MIATPDVGTPTAISQCKACSTGPHENLIPLQTSSPLRQHRARSDSCLFLNGQQSAVCSIHKSASFSRIVFRLFTVLGEGVSERAPANCTIPTLKLRVEMPEGRLRQMVAVIRTKLVAEMLHAEKPAQTTVECLLQQV